MFQVNDRQAKEIRRRYEFQPAICLCFQIDVRLLFRTSISVHVGAKVKLQVAETAMVPNILLAETASKIFGTNGQLICEATSLHHFQEGIALHFSTDAFHKSCLLQWEYCKAINLRYSAKSSDFSSENVQNFDLKISLRVLA